MKSSELRVQEVPITAHASLRPLGKNTVIILHILFCILMGAKNVSAKKFFHIERPRLGLELSYEFETEKRTTQNISTDHTTHDFSEKLEIETGGWLYHPALLIYTLRFEPELQQKVGKKAGNMFKPGYFIDATFLQYKPYTLNIYAQRYSTTLSSAFVEKSDTESDIYGANLRLKYRVLPTTLSYIHRSSSQTGFYNSQEDSDDFRLAMRHYGKKHDTHLNATYSDKTRTTRGIATNIQSLDSTLHNYYDIKGDRKIVLNSLLSYRWTENDISTSSLRISENFYWKHKKNLRSDYKVNYHKNQYGSFDREIIEGGAGLTHLLYENLTTSLKVDVSRADFTGGKENVYGGSLDFNYRRKIPWGTFTVDIGHDFRYTQRDYTENYIPVIDESHILITGTVTLLDNRNIDTSSIRVTDNTGTILYIENIDYRITPLDPFTRIERTTFGAIANGQEVLVSYQYLTNPAYDDTTFGQTYAIGLDLWSILRLYYRYNHLTQTIVAGIPPDKATDDTSHTAEIRLDWRWSKTRLAFEDSDRSTGISTRWWIAEETLTFRPTKKTFFNITGHYGRTRFKEDGETEDFYGVRSYFDWMPATWCKLGLEGFWDTISGETEKTFDLGFASTLELSYGIWSGKITYRLVDEREEMSSQRRTNHYVLLQINRTLW